MGFNLKWVMKIKISALFCGFERGHLLTTQALGSILNPSNVLILFDFSSSPHRLLNTRAHTVFRFSFFEKRETSTLTHLVRKMAQ